MRGETRNPVSKCQIKECRTCGNPIAFVKNKKGAWFPVDVLHNEETGQNYYKGGAGAYGNLTPWHRCTDSNAAEELRIKEERDAKLAAINEQVFELMVAGKMDEAKALMGQARTL